MNLPDRSRNSAWSTKCRTAWCSLRAQRKKALARAARASTGTGGESGKAEKTGKAGKDGKDGKDGKESSQQELPGVARALPATLKPQLATLVDGVPPNAADWIYEVKFDGYRILARLDEDGSGLYTRNGHD